MNKTLDINCHLLFLKRPKKMHNDIAVGEKKFDSIVEPVESVNENVKIILKSNFPVTISISTKPIKLTTKKKVMTLYISSKVITLITKKAKTAGTIIRITPVAIDDQLYILFKFIQ